MSNLIGVVQSGAMRADSIRPFPAAAGNAGNNKHHSGEKGGFILRAVPGQAFFKKICDVFPADPPLTLATYLSMNILTIHPAQGGTRPRGDSRFWSFFAAAFFNTWGHFAIRRRDNA